MPHKTLEAARIYRKKRYAQNRKRLTSYARNYYAQNRENILKRDRGRYQKNKKAILERTSRWAKNNRHKTRIYGAKARERYLAVGGCYYCGHDKQGNKRMCPTCTVNQKRGQDAERKRLKDAALKAYGGKCACCGEINRGFLTLDHPKNNGAAHRRETGCGTGEKFYRWLKKNNYPSDFQVLCWNCNCGKRDNGGVCPHKAIQ